ncbi:MAG: hypothetical protein HYX75_12370 [Acidobacteria bacterium]|nr:hypothetical protein [Acidobacteriota bacterium]
MKWRVMTIAFALAALMGSQAAAQTVDEIIAKHIQARGGLEKLQSVKTMKVTGKMTMGGGMEAPFTVQMKRPNMFRLDATVQGMTMTQAFDGTTAWKIFPFMGSKAPEKMTEEETKETQKEADIDGPLVGYKEKGHSVELMGKEEMEGTEAYKVKLTMKDGDIKYIYLDGENFLELKESSKSKHEGAEIEVERLSGNYKPVEGIMIAHSVEGRAKGAASGQTVTIDTIELNATIEDSLFAMPPAPAPEPQPSK